MSSGINEIFEQLREDNSGNYKINVLKEHQDNELLQKVLLYTYSPFKQYYIKQIPTADSTMNDSGQYMDMDALFYFLDVLSRRDISGNDMRDQVSYTMDHLYPSDAKVFYHILDRSIDCGMSAKTVNKVWNKLIPEIPYMRCEKLNDKTKKNINYPAVVQLKADGTFINIIKHDKTVSCMTRNGTEFSINKVNTYFEHILTDIDNFVITGEMVLYKDGKVLERKVGNGMINSYIKREATRDSLLQKQKDLISKGKGATKAFTKLIDDLHTKEQEWKEIERSIVIEGWDLIDYSDWSNGKSDETYKQRFMKFNSVANECDFLTSIETVEVGTFEEAQDFANDMMSKGLEGAVLKNLNAPWENKTSKNQIKLKAELDADLLVYGYTPGTGDFTDGIGSLLCKTSDGLLEVSIGSGLSREQRGLQRVDETDMTKGLMLREDINSLDDFFDDTYNNKIIAVKYNEVIKSEGRDTYSLFLPIFDEIRFDKDTADTLKRLKG